MGLRALLACWLYPEVFIVERRYRHMLDTIQNDAHWLGTEFKDARDAMRRVVVLERSYWGESHPPDLDALHGISEFRQFLRRRRIIETGTLMPLEEN